MKTSIRTHQGRVALVTGAAQGIGQALALALAERGSEVIVTDLTLPQETVNKIGPTGHAFQLDVTQEEDWRSLSVKSRDVGEVDIVVNNAGYFPNRSIDELDLPTWRKTMATNLDAQFLSAKYFLPAMRKKKWGRFIGISSNMVGLAIPGMSHYIATKMGIIGFMRGLANDVASDGITANAVLPGLTNTLATAPQSEEQKRSTWEQQAIKRLGEPEDVTGSAAAMPYRTPFRLMSIISSQSSTRSSSRREIGATPALLTSTSSLPKRSQANFMRFDKSPRRFTSVGA